MSTINPTAPLRDVLYAFSLAKAVPDAQLLDEFVGQYPHYTAEITDFAIEVAIDAAISDDMEPKETRDTLSPAVSRAMSRFQNRVFELRQGKAPGATAAPTATS